MHLLFMDCFVVVVVTYIPVFLSEHAVQLAGSEFSAVTTKTTTPVKTAYKTTTNFLIKRTNSN